MKQLEGITDLGLLELTRPFFSIVISCYNSRKTIGTLLESLCHQNLEYTDLEVIISDDCSTEPYNDIVQEYLNRVWIKEVKTEYNCCPGNTRERGAQEASGIWLCFSDHDDIFMEGALGILKDKLQNELSSERYCVYTSFYELLDDYKTINREVIATDSGGWTHGKFYNLDNFWKEYDIHYKKDLMSNEDIYLTCYVNAVLNKIHTDGANALTYVDDLFTYGWVGHSDSVSHKRNKDDYNFLELHFTDYVDATGVCYLDAYYNGIIDYTTARNFILDAVLLYYFYYESFFFYNPRKVLANNKLYLIWFFQKIKKEFDLNNRQIWQHAAANRAYAFNQALEKSNIATGGMIPSLTLSEWLIALDDDGSFITDSPYCYKK